MARTPHLRTDLSAREVATAVREAADLIDALRAENDDLKAKLKAEERAQDVTAHLRDYAVRELTRYKGMYDNLLRDWNADQERIKTLTKDRDVAEAAATERGWKP